MVHLVAAATKLIRLVQALGLAQGMVVGAAVMSLSTVVVAINAQLLRGVELEAAPA